LEFPSDRCVTKSVFTESAATMCRRHSRQMQTIYSMKNPVRSVIELAARI